VRRPLGRTGQPLPAAGQAAGALSSVPATPPRYDDLTALFINCTLKRSPERSHSAGLIEVSTRIMKRHGVGVDVLRAVDHDIATGVWPDMTQHGWANDEWPQIYAKVMAADILVIAGPIWLEDNSSVTKKVIERLYVCSPCSTTPGSTPTTGGWVAA
jgi:hypothetical protein